MNGLWMSFECWMGTILCSTFVNFHFVQTFSQISLALYWLMSQRKQFFMMMTISISCLCKYMALYACFSLTNILFSIFNWHFSFHIWYLHIHSCGDICIMWLEEYVILLCVHNVYTWDVSWSRTRRKIERIILLNVWTR